jgi:hypothetical protein
MLVVSDGQGGWLTISNKGLIEYDEGKCLLKNNDRIKAFINNCFNSLGQEYIGHDKANSITPLNDCDTWLENNTFRTGIDLKKGWGDAHNTTADGHRKKAGEGESATRTQGLKFVVMQDNRTQRTNPYPDKVDSHVAAIYMLPNGRVRLFEMGGHGYDSHVKEYNSLQSFQDSYPYYSDFTYYPAEKFFK